MGKTKTAEGHSMMAEEEEDWHNPAQVVREVDRRIRSLNAESELVAIIILSVFLTNMGEVAVIN